MRDIVHDVWCYSETRRVLCNVLKAGGFKRIRD